jgi:hypothetical protein
VSERDDDILEFDFFDEPPTVEQQPGARVRMPRRRRNGEPPRPPIRPPQGFTPLLRLIGLIAFAILIVVLLVFWVQSCQSSSKRNAYKSYMQDVGEVANASEGVGRDLQTALTTQGAKPADVVATLRSLSQREQQSIDKAQSLKPPGALRTENQAVVEALQFRRSGLEGLAATLRPAQGKKAVAADADTLAEQSQRFVASDVVWDDLFRDPSQTEMQKQGITGIQVPGSSFLDDAALATAAGWTPILQRLEGATTGGSSGGAGLLHGSALKYVKALPSGKELSSTEENTVITSTDLAFSVGVENSGNAQEVGIQVTLTIQKQPQPIVKTKTIQVIDPGQVKTVVFKNFGQVPLVSKTTLKVDIAPVPHEARKENNSASYSVIFSFA